MNCIEIIQLRAPGVAEANQAKTMINRMHTSRSRQCVYDSDIPRAWKIFKSPLYQTDISLHLYWEKESCPSKPSIFGLRIAKALEYYGLISHSIWQET